MIRIDQYWLAAEPIDMRSGMESVLAKVVSVFGQAQAHHAYLFTNRRATRIKVLVADGFGVWLASRRLHEGQFVWAEQAQGLRLGLTASQIDALILGLPWKRVSKPVVVGVA